jgi:coenzyme Q-binding protein COQ10
MPAFQSTRRVPHSPTEMFDLVADVERYPEFLPLCEDLRVRRRSRDAEGRDILVADMTIGYKAIHETFTSRVTLDRPNLRITVQYVDGPFRHLENRWTFADAEDDGCTIGFFLSYEFRSFTLGLLMGAVFDRAFRRFADAFEERAAIIYGDAPKASPAG